MPLAPGLYEHALTAALAASLADAPAELHELRPEQLAATIAKHLALLAQ